MTLERARNTLIADLRSRGLVGDEVPEGTDLAMLLMNTYVEFPDA